MYHVLHSEEDNESLNFYINLLQLKLKAASSQTYIIIYSSRAYLTCHWTNVKNEALKVKNSHCLIGLYTILIALHHINVSTTVAYSVQKNSKRQCLWKRALILAAKVTAAAVIIACMLFRVRPMVKRFQTSTFLGNMQGLFLACSDAQNVMNENVQ